VNRPLSRPSRGQSLVLAGVVVLAVLVAAGLGFLHSGQSSPVGGTPGPAVSAGTGTPRSGLPTVAVADLPVQARDTLALIDRGGPYPYRQDNTVFTNVERILPIRAAGYYHEYTVVTPGSADRGTRRLVVGGQGDIFYTGDHYATFRQVVR
jgi:ribonuclease T1